MKTFSFQNDWRCFPRVVAVFLLLLVAGCGGDGDDDDLGDQSVANGLWTGTIGTNTVTAVLHDGTLFAFRSDEGTNEDALIYAVSYEVGEDDATLSGAMFEMTNLTSDMSGEAAAFSAMLAEGATQSDPKTLMGTRGSETVSLAFADSNDEDVQTADLSLLEATWHDMMTWTSGINRGTTTITINAMGEITTGVTAGSGCAFTGDFTAAQGINLYAVEMMVASCTDTDRNGAYNGLAFLSDEGSEANNRLSVMATHEDGNFFITVADKQ